MPMNRHDKAAFDYVSIFTMLDLQLRGDGGLTGIESNPMTFGFTNFKYNPMTDGSLPRNPTVYYSKMNALRLTKIVLHIRHHFLSSKNETLRLRVPTSL